MDLIERQAAIDVAMQYCPDDDGSCSKAGVDIREMLDELESLPSAPRWIPVSERLPEEHKEEEIDVLCFTIHQTMLVASYGKLYPLSDEVGWITNEYNRLDVSSVLAWMPLPKLWKGKV